MTLLPVENKDSFVGCLGWGKAACQGRSVGVG